MDVNAPGVHTHHFVQGPGHFLLDSGTDGVGVHIPLNHNIQVSLNGLILHHDPYPIGRARTWLGFAALAIFLLSFTVSPVRTNGL